MYMMRVHVSGTSIIYIRWAPTNTHAIFHVFIWAYSSKLCTHQLVDININVVKYIICE